MDLIVAIAAIISTIATIVSAVYAVRQYKLHKMAAGLGGGSDWWKVPHHRDEVIGMVSIQAFLVVVQAGVLVAKIVEPGPLPVEVLFVFVGNWLIMVGFDVAYLREVFHVRDSDRNQTAVARVILTCNVPLLALSVWIFVQVTS